MEALVDDPAHDLPEELASAAWLHDIGYAGPLQETMCHAVDGAIHLQRLGFSNLVVSLVAWHTGAAWEAEVRDVFGELEGFPTPPRDLLDVLTLVDLTTGPDGGHVDVEQRIAEILDRYDVADPVHRSVSSSAQALRGSAERARSRLFSR